MANNNNITAGTVGIGAGFTLSAAQSIGATIVYTLTGPDGDIIGNRHSTESTTVVLLVDTFGITWLCADALVRHAAGITNSLASVAR